MSAAPVSPAASRSTTRTQLLEILAPRRFRIAGIIAIILAYFHRNELALCILIAIIIEFVLVTVTKEANDPRYLFVSLLMSAAAWAEAGVSE